MSRVGPLLSPVIGPPSDRVPDGAPAETKDDRRQGGLFAPGNNLAKRGGKAHANHLRLTSRMGLKDLDEQNRFRPYKRAAVSFRRAQCALLAHSVGGGLCGPGPSSLVASAALQLAWSRYLSDTAAESGDPELILQSSRLADASRANLLAAHELCAKEAQARQRGEPDLPLEDALRTPVR